MTPGRIYFSKVCLNHHKIYHWKTVIDKLDNIYIPQWVSVNKTMSNSQISLINKLSWSLLLDFEIKPSTFQTQNDNLEAMNPFVFGIIKNRIKILPKHLYYYMLKSTCAVNLLCKLSIIFKEWRVMNNVAGAELLFSLYFRYYTQSFFLLQD